MKTYEIDDVARHQLISQRLTIAWLCALLPFLSVGFGFIGMAQGVNQPGWWYSISDTFYANSKMFMIGILSITSFYFATYKGYDIRDRIVNIASAVFALMIVIFPCDGHDGLFNLSYKVGGPIHNYSALALYLTFIINTIWLFRLGSSDTKAKKIRNRIYLICGLIIIADAIFIFIAGNVNMSKYIPNYVWICECVAQIAYAFAWFVKSGKIIKD